MKDPRYRQLSTRGPIVLFIVVLVLTVTLTVLWNVALVQDYQQLKQLAAQDGAFHGTFIALGSVLFLTIIILSSILGSQLIGHIRWRQRQSDFIASVSHELNSPLSSIKLFAQTLRSAELSPGDRRNFVEKILFDVERLSRLISNILRAAEIDRRGEELQIAPQELEFGAYLEDYSQDARQLHEEHDLEVEVHHEGETWVNLDGMMFRQVLDNLVDNAVRYAGSEAPHITMTVERRSGEMELRVADRGLGVPAAALPDLFDRFYRVQRPFPSRSRKGTGIGLFIVRSIVQAHGGRVSATSEGIGQGTTIHIRLPLSESTGELAA